jgi:hypothetical protein|tara:strand:+ start:1628 stop:1861 length:234 start_codon:yes stop_codon:yes gene_type:complete
MSYEDFLEKFDDHILRVEETLYDNLVKPMRYKVDMIEASKKFRDLVAEIDISKYDQDEYIKIVFAIYAEIFLKDEAK